MSKLNKQKVKAFLKRKLDQEIVEEYKKYRRSVWGQANNVLIVFSIVLGITSFLFLKNNFLAVNFFIIVPLVFLLPRFLYKKIFQKHAKVSFLKIIELFALIIFILSTSGSLGLYLTSLGYDSLVHFISPMIFTVFVAMLYWFWQKDNYLTLELVLVSASVVIIFSVLWELFEYTGDQLLGTRMFFDPSTTMVEDLYYDLVADILGIFVGGLIVLKYWDRWVEKWRR